MTDTTIDPTHAVEDQPSPDAPQTDPDQAPGDPDASGAETPTGEPDEAQDSPGSEAAKYRVRLREAEHQRDDALERVARLQRAAVDEVLSETGVDARLLDAAGHAVEDYLTDDGLVDRERLAQAARTVAIEFNVTAPRRPAPVAMAGTAAGPAGSSGKADWDRAFTLGGRGR